MTADGAVSATDQKEPYDPVGRTAVAWIGGIPEIRKKPLGCVAALAGASTQRPIRRRGAPAGLALTRGFQAAGTGRPFSPDPARSPGVGSGRGARRVDAGCAEARSSLG